MTSVREAKEVMGSANSHPVLARDADERPMSLGRTTAGFLFSISENSEQIHFSSF